MNRRNIYSALALLGVVALSAAAMIVVARGADNGRTDRFRDGFRVGFLGGSKITCLATRELSFLERNSSTATLSGALPGDGYAVTVGWSSASPDPGQVTSTITTGTLTVTARHYVPGLVHASMGERDAMEKEMTVLRDRITSKIDIAIDGQRDRTTLNFFEAEGGDLLASSK